jgi:enoyl-CoA hydratase/carnithine racemase
MSGHLKIERHGLVTKIIFNRREKKNALTAEMYRAMVAAVQEADRDNSINAVVFCGSAGTFTAGDDIHDFLAEVHAGRDFAGHEFLKTLALCDTPLVAAVEGLAIGVGTTMLFHCDLVYVAPGASFRMPFVDFGLVPTAGCSLIVPRRIGTAKAAELLLLGSKFGPKEAIDLGIANAIIPVDSLFSHAMKQATDMAGKPFDALRATRRLLRGDRAEIVARMEIEMQAFKQAMNSEESRAAFKAFLKRNPHR